nr:hypothetical protein BaRGS_025891 [Batillaria attramentaria]
MPHYHCVAIGCQNGSSKSDKQEKFPETVLPNGGPFASPALESTRLFVTGNSGISKKHFFYKMAEHSLPSLAPLRIPLGSKLVKDDIVRDLVFESTETI